MWRPCHPPAQHISIWYCSNQCNHGYLAVDFFFALSGFVIGYAYDDRWNRMTIGGFFKRRLARLHPMVIMGTVTGACLYFFGQGETFPLIGNVPGWKVALAFVMGCLMIPCGMKMDIRGWGETTPIPALPRCTPRSEGGASRRNRYT